MGAGTNLLALAFSKSSFNLNGDYFVDLPVLTVVMLMDV